MKEIKRIDKVVKFNKLKDKVVIINADGEVSDTNRIKLFKGYQFEYIQPFSNLIVGFSKQKTKLFCFDLDFNLINEILGYYPHLSYKSSDTKFVLTKKEQKKRTTVVFDNNFNRSELKIKPYQVIGNTYIVRNNIEITVYNEAEKKLWEINIKNKGKANVWNSELKKEVEEENSISGDLLNYNDEIAIVPLKGGQLLAVEMNSGSEKWFYNAILTQRQVIFEDRIYGIASESIVEIDANNGELLREIDLKPVKEEYGYYPTGQLEVFKEYLFSYAPDGQIAMFNRDSLLLEDFIQFEGTIPNAHGHLIWHNNKLYVHTWGDVLLIFKKE